MDINPDILSYEGNLKEYGINADKMDNLCNHILELRNEIEDNNIIDYAITDLIVMDTIDILYEDMNLTSIGSVSYSKTVNQLVNRTVKKGFSILTFIEDLLNCIIYQYMKIYKASRIMNKFIRNEFKQLVLYNISGFIGRELTEKNL